MTFLFSLLCVYLDNLERVVDVLVCLPLLRSLELDEGTVCIASAWTNNGVKFWSKLTGIKSIFVYGGANPRIDGAFPIAEAEFSQWSNRGFELCNLETFLHMFRNSQTLEADGRLLGEPDLYIRLFQAPAAIEHNDVQVGVSLQRNCKVDASCITSLSARKPTKADLLWIANLPQLKRLMIDGIYAETTPYNLIPCNFGTLESLKIEIYFVSEPGHLPDALFCSLRRLRALRLRGIKFAGKAMEGNLPELRVLYVTDCSVTDDHFSFFSRLKNLDSLSWTYNRRHHSSGDSEFLAMLTQATNLRSLILAPVLHHKIFHYLERLNNLEVLVLDIRQILNLDGLHKLNGLANLEALRISTNQEPAVLDVLHSLKLSTNLQILYVNTKKWSRLHDGDSELEVRVLGASLRDYSIFSFYRPFG